MKRNIYTYAGKCFAFTPALSLLVFACFAICSCKTNKVETASDRKLLDTDTAKITSWELIPAKAEKTDAYKVMRKNASWLVTVLGSEPSQPDTSYIRRSLKHIADFKASAELNIPQKNWDTLGVTDNDTRFILHVGTEQEELILGKMFFTKENKTAYYVRVKGESKIYKVPLYLDGSIKVPAEKIRKKDMVGLSPEQVQSVLFLKPEGVDFELKRAGQHSWSINSILANDSTSEQYIRQLCKFQVNKYANAPATGAVMSIQITSYSGRQISVRAYKKNSETWIISSSENTGNYVELDEKTLHILFPGKEYFSQTGAEK